MPALDSSSFAAVSGPSLAVAWFMFLDIEGDPLRVTTFGQNVSFTGTSDPDLDGHEFLSFAGNLIDVGDVSHSEGGSDTLTITLSGIVTIDTTLINDIGDKAKWQGRLCRLWFKIYDEDGVTPRGALVSYYTGYMSSVRFTAAPENQTLQLSVENYLAYTTQASNRSYLGQSHFDSGDTSAAATLAAANGLRAGPSGTSPGAVAPSSDGGSYNLPDAF